MNPKRRTAQIQILAQGITRIGPEFERFGTVFMDALLEVPMTHAGTNLLGYPVPGVVDSLSEDEATAVEYSDRADYFDGEMKKAEDDLAKVLGDKPKATEIFLLSGTQRRPQKADTFLKAVTGRPQMRGRTLHLWGSEEIAAKIIDHLIVSDAVVRRLSHYLPDLQRLWEEEAASALTPGPEPASLLRPDVDCELSRRLAITPVVAIAGMAGLGKSHAAAAFAEKHSDDYDLVVWLKAGECKRVEDLKSLPLIRAGETRNITALLKTRACLLVIDDADPGLTSSQLSTLCGPGSHIILTQRQRSAQAYDLPLLAESEAWTILEQAGTPCPEDIFRTIWSTVGGHPLSLNLLRATVQQHNANWPEIALDCRVVGELPDDEGQRLADRMLARLRPMLQRELSVFQWAALAAVNQDFLVEVLAPVGVRKLRDAGLTATDRSGTVRLHDIVFASVQGEIWCDEARDAELTDALEMYLTKIAGTVGLQFWTIARSLKSKLENLVSSGDRRTAFLYALLCVWETTEIRRVLVGDPLVDVKLLVGQKRDELAVIAVIEAVEQLYLLDKLDGDEVARQRLDERMPTFDVMAELTDLTDLERVQIQHHKGKALKRLRRASEAAALFEAVLAGPCRLDEARLQLIDIYRSNPEKSSETIALVDGIFEKFADNHELAFSVLLGVIERLPAGHGNWRNDIIARHAGTIERAIVEAANLGVGQAFSAFAPLGRFLSGENPALFSTILRQLPEPGVESLDSDGDRFAWAEIYAEAAKLPGSDRDRLRAKALTLYEALTKPVAFRLQRQAELLIDMGRPGDGEAMLNKQERLAESEWLQRLMARARLAQGDAQGALSWIESALKRLTAEHFRSEFLELRYDIRTALGEANADADLLAARAVSQKVAEAARLDERIRTAGLLVAQRPDATST
ncbi:NB-ARC domain-containing protein [Paraburkholderia sp. IW21]|uniref:NB-ARC domain-containing protein n=1 Tax=Paraburkholderia sp. IW21 TaxID=3242488 RepID=UPI00351F9C71